jgi:hypothetical protein
MPVNYPPYGLENRHSIPGTRPHRSWGPPSLLSNGYSGFFTWLEVHYSPPSSAEVKNAWSYSSTPQRIGMVWCLIKHRGKFTFTLHLRDITRTSTVILIICHKCDYMSHDSSVGIALGYGLDERGSRVRFPAEAGNFSLHHGVQTGSGAHSASYPMSTRVSFPGVKAAGT